ncbi:hypothetical protein ARALYDRAFT_343288 [Arabidopsis lyrata subsp. lyrata]|uniref:MD-2-related lipid-recognition domain-containing protein n=1 Tax=Arabidopsis lyrata subsp. lyrata TaxID=81972 RepID=D7L862_ARALL|nr:hypothetical protein ARALYDRAFT_343288 [Arabidopsis lyrata subsp. lyrata]
MKLTNGKGIIPEMSVEISPVPVVRNGNANIHITGLAKSDVPHGLTVTIILDVNGRVVSARTYPICDDDVTPCDIVPGGHFEIYLLNIFNAQETRTAVQYQVTVKIDKDLTERMMCIVSIVSLTS